MKKTIIFCFAIIFLMTGCIDIKKDTSSDSGINSNITSNLNSNSNGNTKSIINKNNTTKEAAKKKTAEEAAKKKAQEAAKKKAAEEAAKKKAQEAAKKKAAEEAAKKKAQEAARKKAAEEAAKKKAATTIMLKDNVTYVPGVETFECDETENCVTINLVNKVKSFKGYNVVSYNSNEITIKFIDRLSAKYNNSAYLSDFESVKKVIIAAGTVNIGGKVAGVYNLTKSACVEYNLTCE